VNESTVNVDHQIELGTESIEERGAQVVEMFKNNSLSAWNPNVLRKNWAKPAPRQGEVRPVPTSHRQRGPLPVLAPAV
jgi:hypothetical protein